MAHKLVNDYRQSKEYNIENELTFSYCGGIPKFEKRLNTNLVGSLGVLKALKYHLNQYVISKSLTWTAHGTQFHRTRHH